MTNDEDLSFFDAEAGASAAVQPQEPRTIAQYLVFTVSKRELAIGLAQVSEIVRYEGVSAVPGTPRYVRGVAHVRGRTLPVIDLAVKLGLTPDPTTKRSCILTLELELEGEPFPVGIVVDGVATLLDLDISHIQPSPRFGVSVDVRCLAGLIPTERGAVPLIDFARMFAEPELAQLSLGTQLELSGSPLTRATGP